MEDKIWKCIVKRLTGNETDQSKKSLDFWLAQDPENLIKFEEAKSIWELSGFLEPVQDDISFNGIKEKITPAPAVNVIPFRNKYWFTYRIAASVIGILLGITFYTYYLKKEKSNSVQWLTQTAAPGKTTHFFLPDSSEIWLNAGSKLSYAAQFNSCKVRTVKLTGEAYFKVKHDQFHPFVVHSRQLITTVYGTSFSIRAYQTEAVSSISVNSGKVGVSTLNGKDNGKPIMLLPTDKLTYNINDQSFAKVSINKRDVDAWTKGELIFDETPIPEVFATLSRKFNVNIAADAGRYANCKLSARFENKSLEAILATLKLSMNINTTQINGTINIEGGSVCN